MCLVLVLRQSRRRSSGAHHSRGKHDFNDDVIIRRLSFFCLRLCGLLLGRDESTYYYAQAGVLSVCARESNVRKGSNRGCFFVVFYPKIWTWRSKKARGGQREGGTKREGLFDG